MQVKLTNDKKSPKTDLSIDNAVENEDEDAL